jgi:hypothetical protein
MTDPTHFYGSGGAYPAALGSVEERHAKYLRQLMDAECACEGRITSLAERAIKFFDRHPAIAVVTREGE